MKADKKKTSIDFEAEVLSLVREYVDSRQISLSSGINFLLYNVLGLSKYAQSRLAAKLFELRVELSEPQIGSSLISMENKEKDIYHIKNLTRLYNSGRDDVENAPDMKVVEFAGGTCFVPEEWYVVDESIKPENIYPGVIEIRNMEKYKEYLGEIPHIVFFLATPINHMTTEDEESIEKAIIKAYPEFENLKKMQVEPVYNKDKLMLNYDIYMSAPRIGYFVLPESNNQYTSFPYGAMYVKKES